MNLGKKGKKTGLKRKPAPRFWPIRRKEKIWVINPSSGPHSTPNSLPLGIVLRDFLGFAKTRREGKTIISRGKVYVNGKVRWKDDFPVGLMDVVSIPDIQNNFRVLPSPKGLILNPITKEETKFKLCRIENKVSLKNGHTQLNLNDGSNVFVKNADSTPLTDGVFKTLDTIKLSLLDRQILETIQMKDNCFAIIIGGKNAGKYGKTVAIEIARGKQRRNSLVTIEYDADSRYQTILDYVFAVGSDKPTISLREAT